MFLFRTRVPGFAQQVGGLAPAAARLCRFSAARVAGRHCWCRAVWQACRGAGGGRAHWPAHALRARPLWFAAIIGMAFVGRLHPVGMVFSALLMSMFYIGGELAQSRLACPSLTGVFQGLLLFNLLACDTLVNYRLRWVGPRPAKEGA